MASVSVAGSPKTPCQKCSAQSATLKQRSMVVCTDCFLKSISQKHGKQLGTLNRELGPQSPDTPRRRVLVGLSLGVSSSALVDLLHRNLSWLKEKGRRPPFDVVVVFVDVDGSYQGSGNSAHWKALQKFRNRYHLMSIETIPVASVLGVPTIDWSALPRIDSSKQADEQIGALLSQLPSTTSRADVLRLFIRHVLVAQAAKHSCQALLLGHTTTALAELTLSETAKGRGFSLPWQTNDGPFEVPDFTPATRTRADDAGSRRSILIYHMLRDLLRKELVTYSTLTTPPLTELIVPPAVDVTAPVVSHRDIGIEHVMARYFADVEENYPSIVANVARTMGKLDRLGAVEQCGLCSMPRDALGDETWRGEIGDAGGGNPAGGRLCYGCERSVRG